MSVVYCTYMLIDALPVVLFAALGATLASFIGVISERVHTGEPWMSGRSRCNSCGIPLSGWSMVPVFSWVVLRGRCSMCGSRVPALYALSECVLGALFAYAYVVFGITLGLLAFLLSLSLLTFIVLYDLRHTIVPPLASTLLVLSSAMFAFSMSSSLHQLGYTLLVAGSIGLGFFLLYALSRGRVMGLGDSPVALALSLLAGPYALSGLMFSFWIGAVVGMGILVAHPKGHRMGIEVPFVPFLAAGYLLALLTQWNLLTLTF